MNALKHATDSHDGQIDLKTNVPDRLPQRAMNQCYPDCARRLILMKCRISHGEPGEIQFSDFSSNHILKETKPVTSYFPDLF
jgi:hypothetical protein